jgi:hypothetical protein
MRHHLAHVNPKYSWRSGSKIREKNGTAKKRRNAAQLANPAL